MEQIPATGLRSSKTASSISASKSIDQVNVVWDTPSLNAAGSMPMGNGQVGINLWVEPNGDLRFIISRTDSYSEISRLLKVGEVRVSISPNPLSTKAPFKQELVLRDGVCVISIGRGKNQLTLRVFVDVDSAMVYCVGSSAHPVNVKAHVESWRNERHVIASGVEQNSAWSLHDAPFELSEAADVFPKGISNAVAWYHRNEESVAYKSTMLLQSLKPIAYTVKDPIIHRTFGGFMSGTGLKPADNRTLVSSAPSDRFALWVAAPCYQTDNAQDWLDEAQVLAEQADADRAEKRTKEWWHAFWERSWVTISGDKLGFTIPFGTQPLRVGFDSNGANKFSGEIRRASIYTKPLSAATISRLASAQSANIAADEGIALPTEPQSAATTDTKSLDLKRGMTLEAVIKPDSSQPARIIDSLTAGGSDGFLFDTHPGGTLRLIVGNNILSAPAGIIKAGQWQHVAASVDAATGAMAIYLDGKQVAQQPGSDDKHSPITRAYTLQRYVQACGGKGPFPIKFNGSIFTVEPAVMGMPFNADWRNWGDCHWWQNVRFAYHTMLAAGDTEMMDPLFELYERVRPLCEGRAKLYHNSEGCYFPETMTMWGTYSNGDYGWKRTGLRPDEVQSPWWACAWNQGLELVAIMLDRWDYTGDELFTAQYLLPMAESVLSYFDTRFKKDASGRIILDPTQAVETLWHGVINDMPSTAGLNDITRRLCELPQRITTPAQRRFFKMMRAACPEIPVEDVVVEGKTTRRLAGAQKYDPVRSNCENPELYAIWPFRLYGIGKPGIELARTAYLTRVNHLDVGWGYDGNCAALLGMADEAARIMQVKAANSNQAYRWPASWGPNFDWVPDQDHGGNILLTTQLMLLQSDGEKLLLLPAWPKTWDVHFKLHAPQNTVVECEYKKGKITELKVTPESRRKDVVLPDPRQR